MDLESLKKTPLYESHLKAGAKMVDFGGWAMPVQYQGIIEEHKLVREEVGLFDVSHMGEITAKGPQALDFVQHLITNDAAGMTEGQAIYSPMCYENGGVVDDLLVYKKSNEDFLLVVNASNTEKDFAWMQQNVPTDMKVMLENISEQTAQLALQGPEAEEILQKLTGTDLSKLKYYHFENGQVAGRECLISRTGYTGEDGFEIYCAPEEAAVLWDKLFDLGVKPVGLGARDTLRFEACMPLYGQELSAEITPLEAGFGFFVKLDKEEFIGLEALKKQREQGLPQKLVGLEMVDRGIPRTHYALQINGEAVGEVTSGSYCPSLDKNLGLGFVKTEFSEAGREVDVMVRNKPKKAVIVKKPFYKRGR